MHPGGASIVVAGGQSASRGCGYCRPTGAARSVRSFGAPGVRPLCPPDVHRGSRLLSRRAFEEAEIRSFAGKAPAGPNSTRPVAENAAELVRRSSGPELVLGTRTAHFAAKLPSDYPRPLYPVAPAPGRCSRSEVDVQLCGLLCPFENISAFHDTTELGRVESMRVLVRRGPGLAARSSGYWRCPEPRRPGSAPHEDRACSIPAKRRPACGLGIARNRSRPAAGRQATTEPTRCRREGCGVRRVPGYPGLATPINSSTVDRRFWRPLATNRMAICESRGVSIQFGLGSP